MTLYQSQENVPKAIETGVEARKVFEKTGDLKTVANVSTH